MGESDKKSRVLEDLVATIHRVQGFDCRTRVRLPSKYSDGKPREIDVLVDFTYGPYAFQFAIECKNYSSKIEAEQIDAFESKLCEVGLPVSGSIFVSTSGFRSGALAKAKSVGIRPLMFVGLDRSRLQQEVSETLHQRLFLVPKLKNIHVVHEMPNPGISQIALIASGNRFVGTVFDLVWRDWVLSPSTTLGTRTFEYNFSGEFGFESPMGPSRFVSASIEVLIEGHFLGVAAGLKRASLVDPNTNSELYSVSELQALDGTSEIPLRFFASEKDLTGPDIGISDVTRVPIPRICLSRWDHGQLLWPPSDAGWEHMYHANLDPFFPFQSSMTLDECYEPVSEMYISKMRQGLGSGWGDSFWSLPLIQSLISDDNSNSQTTTPSA